MFDNKKINYIFVSLGDVPNNEKKTSFFQKVYKKFFKKDKTNENNDYFLHKLTEDFIFSISKYTEKKCFSFYLNLEFLHNKFLDEIQQNSKKERYYIFPLYPQYCQETCNIANFFSINFPDEILDNFFWTKSFHNHPFFIKAIQKNINTILKKYNLDQKDTIFLFLANDFSETNNLYLLECETTCQNIIKSFQYIEGFLYYFSDSNLEKIKKSTRKNVIIIPITNLLYDNTIKNNIENFKLSLQRDKKNVFISKPLNENNYFIRSILNIIDEKNFVSNTMLLNY